MPRLVTDTWRRSGIAAATISECRWGAQFWYPAHSAEAVSPIAIGANGVSNVYHVNVGIGGCASPQQG
jgi:hypothetical protein